MTATNTITYTYDGRTFTLDEDYEHPDWGHVRFVAVGTNAPSDHFGYFRDADGRLLSLRYNSFPPPEPEPVTVRIPTFNSPYPYPFRFTHDEARAAIKALQDALPGDDVWVRLSREDAGRVRQDSRTWAGCEGCRRVEAAITEALER